MFKHQLNIVPTGSVGSDFYGSALSATAQAGSQLELFNLPLTCKAGTNAFGLSGYKLQPVKGPFVMSYLLVLRLLLRHAEKVIDFCVFQVVNIHKKAFSDKSLEKHNVLVRLSMRGLIFKNNYLSLIKGIVRENEVWL